MQLNDQNENKILKKLKRILSLKIFRILALLIFAYMIYMLVITLIFEEFGSKYEDAYYTKVALNLTEPNVFGDHDLMNDSVTSFGTQKFSLSLMKRVGDHETIFGEVHVTKNLLSDSFSHVLVDHPGKKQLSEFSFNLPEDPRTKQTLYANENPSAWTNLEKLPEGTVGVLKFSTTSYMTPEEMIQLVEDYDVKILWMPLFTGELIDYETPYGGGGQSISIYKPFGLAGGRAYGNDGDKKEFRSGTTIYWLNEQSLADSKQFMMDNMADLLEKGPSYYENFLGLGFLQERYDYINKEGFIVYGAVVTGPVKELLKLRDVEAIRNVQLGDVALWNWEER